MKVIYTEQCLQSLDESLFFLIYEQKIPVEKIKQILDELLSRAEELSANPSSVKLKIIWNIYN